MLKPNSLRAEITKYLPSLGRDPDRLMMNVERGAMRATANAEEGFAWEYDLEILIADFTDEPALLFFIIQNWARSYQPELIAAGETKIPFEVEFIDTRTVDLKITLALAEVVRAEPREDGEGWTIETVAETLPIFPDAVPLRDLSAPLGEIWIRSGDDTRKIAPADTIAA